MGILKNLTISQRRDVNGNFSVLLQKCPSINQPSLVFEGGAIVNLSADETNNLRRENSYAKLVDAYACLGILQDSYEESKTVLYMVVVVACSSVGKFLTSEIFRITEVEIILLNGPSDHELVRDLKRLFKTGCFYFSHSTSPNQQPYDLTLCAQRASMTNSTDSRFFWNRILFRHFERFNIDTSSWLVKMICGGLNISTVYIGGVQAKACLFSRLSCERAGTRFNVRGVNDFGHVANFVETEQVVFINRTVYSFVMIRGSIPLFWEQPGVQVGSHRIKMSRGSEISQSAYDKHMFLLKERYEDIVLVNLLSSKNSEILLNQLFNEHHKISKIGSQFHFLNFDYHALCPRGHKENLEKMFITDLQSHCNRYGFFHADNGEVRQMQNGVIRVNCLDCLDRTNSMQTFLGLKMLESFAKSIENLDSNIILTRLNDTYSNLWVQNGDQISRIYTGTGAIEGKNIIKDGALSVARTIQNNLFDDDKQGAIDVLILGRSLNRDYSYRSASLLPHYYMYAPSNLLVKMCDRYLDFCKPEKLKIVVGTWNVNGGKHFDNTTYNRARPLSDWLVNYKASVEYGSGDADLINQCEDEIPVDIYAIGFQEIVDLNAGNIVASSTRNQLDWLVEIQRTISSKDHSYLLVTSVQLVGVCLFVFIRAPLAPHLSDIHNDQVKTGLGGATGNKGGVATRLRYKSTSFCFICAHFAAGQNQVKERNDDYAEITRRLQFSMGRSVNSHDYIFWCGDFNYRLDKVNNDVVRAAAKSGNYELLLAHDQLKLSQANGDTFRSYIEGPINFAPTYKYDSFSNEYDSSEKCRIPAYTDRIMFKKRHRTYLDEKLTDLAQIKFYNRVELISSDHRPVIAEFEIQVLEVDKTLRRQVFDQVLDQYGPMDSTVTVQLEGSLPISDEVVTSILKLFVDEAGQIVVSRFVGNVMVVIFRDGQSALNALSLNDYTLSVDGIGNSRLIIDLKSPSWRQKIYSELLNNMDNTTNLVTGQEPSVHLEDDEDEAAQELNASIGPEINAEQLSSINIDFLVPQEKETPSTSPVAEPPPRPPLPQTQTMKLKPPTRAPPPIPVSISPIDHSGQDLIDSNNSIINEENLDISAINIDDLSSSFDFEGIPPPSFKPPALPSTKEDLILPSIPETKPVALSIQNLEQSTRAPPPPIPARVGTRNT